MHEPAQRGDQERAPTRWTLGNSVTRATVRHLGQALGAGLWGGHSGGLRCKLMWRPRVCHWHYRQMQQKLFFFLFVSMVENYLCNIFLDPEAAGVVRANLYHSINIFQSVNNA